MEGKLIFIITLENPKSDDKVCEIWQDKMMDCYCNGMPYPHINDHFEKAFFIYKGGFIMRKVTVVASRKTDFGNTFFKTVSFNASATNF